MEEQDRGYIQGIAQLERAIRNIEEDEFVRVTAARGEFAGIVTNVHAADPGEGNHVVVVQANVFNGDAMDADTHTVTIDFESAFESEYDYYCPYVVGTADSRSLGDVGEVYAGEIVGAEQ
jgi:hypothetical protein